MSDIRARELQTGAGVRISIAGRTVAGIEPTDTADLGPVFVAPAFWDIQTNGRWGVSFSSPTLTPHQVVEIVRSQAALGTARLCPTLITAPHDSFILGLRAIAEACDSDADVAAMVAGIHLEGPYISPVDGYRGAHPYEAVREPDWDEFRRFQDASGGRVVLMTLSPEHPGALEFIERVVGSGVVVALGHTAADGATLRAAAQCGATLSTHLGNGIASTLPRHPNPIWEQAAIDELSASFIADGHHLDAATLKVLTRAKTPDRVILVSDASPLAGLPTGAYGGWEVHPSGKIVVAGTPYLAGSNQALETGLNVLMAATGLSLGATIATVTTNPARLLGHREPLLEPGAPANLVLLEWLGPSADGSPTLRLLRACVDGNWVDAPTNSDPSPSTPILLA